MCLQSTRDVKVVGDDCQESGCAWGGPKIEREMFFVWRFCHSLHNALEFLKINIVEPGPHRITTFRQQCRGHTLVEHVKKLAEVGAFHYSERNIIQLTKVWRNRSPWVFNIGSLGFLTVPALRSSDIVVAARFRVGKVDGSVGLPLLVSSWILWLLSRWVAADDVDWEMKRLPQLPQHQ